VPPSCREDKSGDRGEIKGAEANNPHMEKRYGSSEERYRRHQCFVSHVFTYSRVRRLHVENNLAVKGTNTATYSSVELERERDWTYSVVNTEGSRVAVVIVCASGGRSVASAKFYETHANRCS